MAHIGASTAAAAAAAAARQRLLEEEEQMTPYSNDELENNWEFKIVRANYEVFRRPNELQKILREEKRAGWILLEKLDNSRLRFKRKRSEQVKDEQLVSNGIDPYRTQYGMSQGKLVILILGVITFVFGIVGFLMWVAW